MTLEIQFPSWTGTQKYDGVKPVTVVQTISFDSTVKYE
jgi:hypothetical protein